MFVTALHTLEGMLARNNWCEIALGDDGLWTGVMSTIEVSPLGPEYTESMPVLSW